LEAAEFDGCEGLGRVGIDTADRKPEEIAGKEEAGHLPPAVGQELRKAQRAARDVEEVSAVVALVEYGAAGVELCDRGDLVQLAQLGVVERLADRLVAHLAGLARKIQSRRRHRTAARHCRFPMSEMT